MKRKSDTWEAGWIKFRKKASFYRKFTVLLSTNFRGY